MANDNDSDDTRICKVYDKEDFFTTAVQLVLAAAALASLYFKRLREVPRRTFHTWFLDVSKQAIGAGYAHVLNMIVAAVISNNIRGDTAQLADQCAWYGMSYIIDTSLGLFLAILFLDLLDKASNRWHWTWLKHSGVYVGSTALLHWSAQVVAWLAILTLTKTIIYIFMWVCSAPLAVIGGLLFAPLQGNIRFELVFVMILFPGVLNVIYFWIADGFLKAKKEHAAAHEHPAVSSEALMTSTEKEQAAAAAARTASATTSTTVASTTAPSTTAPSWTNTAPPATEATIV